MLLPNLADCFTSKLLRTDCPSDKRVKGPEQPQDGTGRQDGTSRQNDTGRQGDTGKQNGTGEMAHHIQFSHISLPSPFPSPCPPNPTQPL